MFYLTFSKKKIIFLYFSTKCIFIYAISNEASLNSHKSFNISDNILSNTFIGHIPLTEKEAIENYQLLFGRSSFRNLVNYFLLNNKGEIKTIRQIDRDDEKNICGPLQCCKMSLCQIKFEVIFSPIQTIGNFNSNFRTVNVTINIIDENDSLPFFLKQKYDIFIIESNNFPLIILPKAIDRDSLENGVKLYSIDNNYNNLFFVSISNQSPILNITDKIDYENNNQRLFNFNLFATDDIKNIHKCRTIINIFITDANDNYPTFSFREKTIQILENISINSIIYEFKATDNDSGINSVISYSLSPLSEPKSINKKFHLDPLNGSLRLIDQVDYENFDQRIFKFIVIATDGGRLALSTTVTLLVKVIDINDNVPELIVHLNNSIIENEPSGKIVLSFSFTDRDELSKNQLKCEFQRSFGLSIDSVEDGIYRVSSTQQFDAELHRLCWIEINCVDNAIPLIEKLFHLNIPIIDINDNFPRFKQEKYFFQIEENLPIATNVYQVSATDLDISDSDNLKFSIIYCNFFNIDPNNGILSIKTNIDREEIENFHFEIQVTDTGQLINKSQIFVTILDVNDNAPQSTTLMTYHVPENSPTDYTVAQLSFIDTDKLENGSFSFKEYIMSLNSPFKLTKTGKIVLMKQLDREKHDLYLIPFVVYDHGHILSLTTTATVSIHIQDVNDNKPIFIYPTEKMKYGLEKPIYYDSPSRTTIITLKGSDQDLNENGKMAYRLEKSNASNFIKVNSETGEIYFFYREEPPKPGLYTIKASVSDHGNPSLSSSLEFFIILSQANFPNKPTNRMINKQRNFFSNVVIFSLIIVFSTALISTLIAVVVWVRSKQNSQLADSPDLCNYISMHEDEVVHNHDNNTLNAPEKPNTKTGNKFEENIHQISPDLIFIDHLIQTTSSNWDGTLCTFPQSSNNYKYLSKPYHTLNSNDHHFLNTSNPILNQDPCIFIQSQCLINNDNCGESTTRSALLERRYPNFKTVYLDNQC